jgi:hypothetical protein
VAAIAMLILPNIASSWPGYRNRPLRQRKANRANPKTKAVALGKIGRLFRSSVGVDLIAAVFLGYQAVATGTKYFPIIFMESRLDRGFVSLTDFRVYLLF